MIVSRLLRCNLGCALVWLGSLGLAQLRVAATGDPELIRVISAVGAEGRGNVAAAKAWQDLSSRNVDTLLPILEALDSANDLAANWLRSAIETIVSRELAGTSKGVPTGALESFVLNTSHQAQARRLAYELIARVDSVRAEKLLAGMINDPGSELRRDAVGRALEKAALFLADGKTEEARKSYRQLLTQARDVDQVDQIVKALRKMGETVEVAQAFGFVTEWKVIGPFGNGGGKGFAVAYPPEQGVDLSAEYPGKSGPVQWRDLISKEDYGDVSMNLPFKHLKGVAAYAYTEFHAEKAMPVELRLGSENAFKVWLNGKYLFGQDEYHRLKEIDQYPMRAELKPGKNEILVKVCQNEQTEDWADGWDFQLRICDLFGAPLFSTKGAAQ
jgi:hypothetical protein